jgi:anti-sigma regulatory factor (Ser/Thr protein kinase)
MSFIELAPLPEAVPCARLLAVQLLHAWGLPELIDDAQLVVSELVTNAVTASATLPGRPMLSLQMVLGERSLRIEVQDQSPLDIEPHKADADAEHGRGFAVIAAFSSRWGTKRTEHDRKTVWAELTRPRTSGHGDAAAEADHGDARQGDRAL